MNSELKQTKRNCQIKEHRWKNTILGLLSVAMLAIGALQAGAQEFSRSEVEAQVKAAKQAEKEAGDAEAAKTQARLDADNAAANAQNGKSQEDTDADTADAQAAMDQALVRTAVERAEASQANVDPKSQASIDQAKADQDAATAAIQAANKSEAAATTADHKADQADRKANPGLKDKDNPQKINRDKQKNKRKKDQDAWNKRRAADLAKKKLNWMKGHQAIAAVVTGTNQNTLAALVASGQATMVIAGTGETIGHVADLRIQNLTAQRIHCFVPPMILESGSGMNQDYACPRGQDISLPAHRATTIPMNGTCLMRNRPPVADGVTGDLLVNEAMPSASTNSSLHLAPQAASDLLRIASSKYAAADALQRDGALTALPYSDPRTQKEIVVQWSTWTDPRISAITGAPPATKEDLRKVVYNQVDAKGPMTPEKKKKVDRGIDTIFEKIELTTSKAKDLEQPNPTRSEKATTFRAVPSTGEQGTAAAN